MRPSACGSAPTARRALDRVSGLRLTGTCCLAARHARGSGTMAERKKFEVSLVTPEGAAFEGECEMLVVPGDAGEIGVLARHAPLVAMLRAGSTRVHLREGEVLEFATGPGLFKVEQDRALALVGDSVEG